MECSAKDNYNVTEVFKTLLSLSRFITMENNEPTVGLKRRSSAYVSATSKGMYTFYLTESLFVNTYVDAVWQQLLTYSRHKLLKQRLTKKKSTR